ncbi:hypothetical protein NC653_006244 [Populus alba x Populus x berolinensis]|uniref:Uncharacterized protein n=1 Tax=Populus alba x Populus x berolinensis TaxID=444605 RepID=A0AAD6RE68_9ROSI|nr:hypothetical protein NC653_006244 [Populus alba x Populus x berolinensis]
METGFHDDVRSIITRSPTLSLFSLFVSLLANMPLQGPNQLHELSSTLSLCVLTCTVSISYDGTWEPEPEPEPEPASVTKKKVLYPHQNRRQKQGECAQGDAKFKHKRIWKTEIMTLIEGI